MKRKAKIEMLQRALVPGTLTSFRRPWEDSETFNLLLAIESTAFNGLYLTFLGPGPKLITITWKNLLMSGRSFKIVLNGRDSATC